MNYDITSAKHVKDYQIDLVFRDGASGTADLTSIIIKGGVFEPLAEVDRFKQFKIDPLWDTLTWNDGTIDIAPETLYIMATGREPQPEAILMVAEESEKYGTQSDN